MKRKVIKQGHNTLTITLPSIWVKENNIQSGDEINYELQDNSLVITCDEQHTENAYRLDMNQDDIILEREVGSLFKRGYDLINITSDDPQLLSQIQDIVGYTMVGFEVVCQGKNNCEIKRVAEIQETEFGSIMNRTLYQLQIMAEGVYEAMKSEDINAIPNLKSMERNNNRYTAFLRRIINKGHYSEKKNDKLIYTFVEFIEKIADEYKYLCSFLLSNKKNIKEIPKEILEIFKEIVSLIAFTIKCHYKFNRTELYNNFRKRKVLIGRTIKFITTHNGRDCMVAHYALAIIQELADVWSLILTINQLEI